MSSIGISDRPVVVLGSGRCGSTLLQSILNTNSSFLIWGEHNGFLSQIASAYFAATCLQFPKEESLQTVERIERLRDSRRWSGWDNLCGKSEFRERFRFFIRSLFADPAGRDLRWGFKEIRYPRNADDQALQLMFECFPETHLIVLIREPEPTIFSILSRWTFFKNRHGNIEKEEVDKRILRLAEHWASQYAQLHSFCQTHAQNCLEVRYEDLGHSETYRSLAQFLETGSFDYQSRIATVKNSSNKTDATAVLIRQRIDVLRPHIANTTCHVRAAYGYPSFGDSQQPGQASHLK